MQVLLSVTCDVTCAGPFLPSCCSFLFYTSPKNLFVFILPDKSCIQMSMRRLHARHLDLLAMLNRNRTIYNVNRARGSRPYVRSTISSCALLQEQSCLRTYSTTCTKYLGIRHDPQCSYWGTTMLRQNQPNPRLMSTHATAKGVKKSPKNERVKPEVHHVEVKIRDSNNKWEKVKTIFTQQRAGNDGVGRACERWLWISFSGSEPTKKELALEWPREKQDYRPRTLQDRMRCEMFETYDVMEKIGENGRRFWRDSTKRPAGGTFEQRYRQWEETTREDVEIVVTQRLMERDW